LSFYHARLVYNDGYHSRSPSESSTRQAVAAWSRAADEVAIEAAFAGDRRLVIAEPGKMLEFRARRREAPE